MIIDKNGIYHPGFNPDGQDSYEKLRDGVYFNGGRQEGNEPQSNGIRRDLINPAMGVGNMNFQADNEAENVAQQ